MDILKQYYLILVLFIFTALFIVFAANNIYINNTRQFIFITVFVILFIIILVISSKFYKFFYTNRYLVYGIILLITIILIILIATNTYNENFVGIKINKTDNTSSTVFASDIDTNATLTDITNKQDTSPVTVSDVDKICITTSNHFGIYDKDLKCKIPYDIANERRLEEQRRLKEEELERERLIQEEEDEKREILEHEKMCKSKYQLFL